MVLKCLPRCFSDTKSGKIMLKTLTKEGILNEQITEGDNIIYYATDKLWSKKRPYQKENEKETEFVIEPEFVDNIVIQLKYIDRMAGDQVTKGMILNILPKEFRNSFLASKLLEIIDKNGYLWHNTNSKRRSYIATSKLWEDGQK